MCQNVFIALQFIIVTIIISAWSYISLPRYKSFWEKCNCTMSFSLSFRPPTLTFPFESTNEKQKYCKMHFCSASNSCLLLKYLLMETNLINANKLFFMKANNANKASEVEAFISVRTSEWNKKRLRNECLPQTMALSNKQARAQMWKLDVKTHIKCTYFHPLGFPCSLNTPNIYHFE